MGFDQALLYDRVTIFLLLLLSLSVHECAHAWTAWRLGDDTARYLGRLTLNPLAHIDLVGTVLLPLLGVPFGWAKPVPVNPVRFTRRISMAMGSLLVSVAGPISNLAIALLTTVALGLLWRFHPDLFDPEKYRHHQGLFYLLSQLAALNVGLAVFNLLPIPPLDGHWIADALMPRSLRPQWESFCRFGPVALAAVVVLPILLGVNILSWPIGLVRACLDHVLLWIAG